MSERKGEYLARLLIRHKLIDRAVIDDPEGYDGGRTLAAVIEASEELGVDRPRAEIERLKAGYNATGFEGWPCPGCRYENGVFISHCALHAEIERLKRENELLSGRCRFILEAKP